VCTESPPEAPAQERGVHPHLLLGQPRELGGHFLRPRLVLGRHPDVASVRSDVGGTGHRLHGGVVQERHFVHGLDALSCAGERRRRVAVLTGFDARLLCTFDELGPDPVRVE